MMLTPWPALASFTLSDLVGRVEPYQPDVLALHEVAHGPTKRIFKECFAAYSIHSVRNFFARSTQFPLLNISVITHISVSLDSQG